MKTKEPEIVGDLMIYLIPSVSIWRQPSCFASAFRLDFFIWYQTTWLQLSELGLISEVSQAEHAAAELWLGHKRAFSWLRGDM